MVVCFCGNEHSLGLHVCAGAQFNFDGTRGMKGNTPTLVMLSPASVLVTAREEVKGRKEINASSLVGNQPRLPERQGDFQQTTAHKATRGRK